MARSKRKGKKGADSLWMAAKVIVVSVAVFFIGYYTMFFVVRSITGPFTESPGVQTQADTGAAESNKAATKSTGDSSASANTNQSATQGAAQSTGSAGKSTTQSSAQTSATSQPATSSPSSSTPKSVVAETPSTAKPTVSASTESSTTAKTTMWRVRVGNYTDRAEADTELPLVRTYAAQAYVVSDNGFKIQAGAFQDEAAARRLAADLAEKGFTVEVAAVN